MAHNLRGAGGRFISVNEWMEIDFRTPADILAAGISSKKLEQYYARKRAELLEGYKEVSRKGYRTPGTTAFPTGAAPDVSKIAGDIEALAHSITTLKSFEATGAADLEGSQQMHDKFFGEGAHSQLETGLEIAKMANQIFDTLDKYYRTKKARQARIGSERVMMLAQSIIVGNINPSKILSSKEELEYWLDHAADLNEAVVEEHERVKPKPGQWKSDAWREYLGDD